MPKYLAINPNGLSTREVVSRLAKPGSISCYLGEHLDAIAIFTILIINASIGFLQVYKADNAI